MTRVYSCLALLLTACLLQAVPQAKPDDSEAKAKELFERACSHCHDLESTARTRNTRERWAAIVDEILARGARLSDMDGDTIVDYLARNYGGEAKK